MLVLDVTEAEADKLLATLDPLAGLAEANRDALTSLLASVETDGAAVQAMLANLGAGDITTAPSRTTPTWHGWDTLAALTSLTS